jgi:O-methyltransferase involved in polyketide biosynthesis
MGRATDATRAVTQSANSIAALRAVESERADGLMKDPWARELAGARAMARADARRARTGIRGESRCARSFSTIS